VLSLRFTGFRTAKRAARFNYSARTAEDLIPRWVYAGK
jgi:hypothetical protein